MSEAQSALQDKVIDLLGDAFSGFCEDIGGMFGVDMACEQVNVTEKCTAEIKKNYKKVAAVYSVNTSGSMNGEIKIFIDRAAVFTMGGVVVMLPESRILNNAKRGTLADTVEMSDAIGEVGNLLIGCWGRVFREGLKDNTHFTQTGTFIGDIASSDSDFDLTNTEEATFVSYKVTVGDYPSFCCGVYLPAKVFEAKVEPEIAPSEDKTETTEDATADTKPETIQEDQAAPEQSPDRSTESDTHEEVQVESNEAVVIVEQEAEQIDTIQEEPVPQSVTEPEPSAVETVEQPSPVAYDIPIPQPEPAVHSGQSGRDYLAKELMCSDVHWMTDDDTVGQAQTKMHQLGVSYLLIGNGSKIEGIVTKSDLAGAASIYLRPIFAKWRRPEDDATLQIRLKWIMSKQIYAVKPETPLANIVHLKCKYDISYLPVVDTQGHVQGVVTTKDIFKAIMKKEISTAGVVMA